MLTSLRRYHYHYYQSLLSIISIIIVNHYPHCCCHFWQFCVLSSALLSSQWTLTFLLFFCHSKRLLKIFDDNYSFPWWLFWSVVIITGNLIHSIVVFSCLTLNFFVPQLPFSRHFCPSLSNYQVLLMFKYNKLLHALSVPILIIHEHNRCRVISIKFV